MDRTEMTSEKYAALLLLPPFAIAIYYYGITGFLIWTIIYITIVVGLSLQESDDSAPKTSKSTSKSKRRHKDEVPMVEYSDLVVTRIAPKRKKKWEKKMSKYSRIDRKR